MGSHGYLPRRAEIHPRSGLLWVVLAAAVSRRCIVPLAASAPHMSPMGLDPKVTVLPLVIDVTSLSRAFALFSVEAGGMDDDRIYQCISRA